VHTNKSKPKDNENSERWKQIMGEAPSDIQVFFWGGRLTCHKTLPRIIQASSTDPKRAVQTTEDMQDGMFFKVDGYIKMVKALGLAEWESM
jgi:hypothetical protein